ncbi:MAG TPA: SurA N-terminal domain-containing protein [Gaiellaceae bacterium]|nr:SurA N-terminal domain-containing protein [Gaiellaceae bacterium]
MKTYLPIALAAALLAGCGGGGSSSKLGSGDVAVVGNQHISQASYNLLINQAKRSYQQQKKKFPKQGTSEFQTIQSQAVTLLVQEAERAQKAKSMGINVTNAQVTARLNQLKKQYFGGDEKKYQAQLTKEGLTDAQVRDDIQSQLISEAIQAKLTKNIKVSDATVQKYYASHVSAYSTPESRSVRYLKIDKKAAADAAYQQLLSTKGSKKTWCTLAKKYAQDQSAQTCGQATFSKGQTVPAFDKVAFSAPTNKVHAPFYDPKQYKSWFIVEPLTAVKPKTTTPEKKVAATIKQLLVQQQEQTVLADFATNLTKSYCHGSRVKYQAGYAPNPDPCASVNTTTGTTTQ